MEVGRHQPGQIGDVRAGEAAEQVAATLLVQTGMVQDVEPCVLDPLQVGIPLEGLAGQVLDREELGVQPSGMRGDLIGQTAGVIVLEIQYVNHMIQGFARPFLIVQKRLPVLQLIHLLRVPMPLDPEGHQPVVFGAIPGLLGVQAVVEVVLLRPGDELVQDRRPLVRQTVPLHKTNLRPPRGCQDGQHADNNPENSMRYHGPLHCILRCSALRTPPGKPFFRK